jgi:hypothetical protein
MFAPTTKWAVLRAILALAALENLELESIDISNTYLNGELHDIDVYMQQPDGFAERDSAWVACLLKGLYYLKQGGRKWFRRLEEVLVELGFTCIRSDSLVFIWEENGMKVIMPVFVDDITLASKPKEKIAEELSQARRELGGKRRLRRLLGLCAVRGVSRGQRLALFSSYVSLVGLEDRGECAATRMKPMLNRFQDIVTADQHTWGSMLVSIILGVDKTTVSVATGNTKYHPYISCLATFIKACVALIAMLWCQSCFLLYRNVSSLPPCSIID